MSHAWKIENVWHGRSSSRWAVELLECILLNYKNQQQIIVYVIELKRIIVEHLFYTTLKYYMHLRSALVERPRPHIQIEWQF